MNLFNIYKNNLNSPTYCLTIDKKCCCDSNNVLIQLIESATQTILACVYKFDSIEILEAIEASLKRGIKITLIMDYKNNFESKYVIKLKSLGAIIFLWNKHEKLHAKFVIIDNTSILTGSFNWTISKRHKIDLIISLYDKYSIKNFNSLFNELKCICLNK